MQTPSRTLVLLILVVTIAVVRPCHAGQPLETESARLLPRGTFEAEATYEWQSSVEGREIATPFDFEYGVSDRTELAVEPVPYTTIRPRLGHGQAATGPGDIEVTLTHLFRSEGARSPALALAAEVKVPTAKNDLIGTGRTDLAGYLILSKRHERSATHLNLSYNLPGSPAGTNLSNTVGYAIAEEFRVGPRFDLVAEFTAVTSATGEGPEGSQPVGLVAEAPGAEQVILAGLRYGISPNLTFAMGVSYDNNHALLLRPGITWHVGRPSGRRFRP